MNTKQIGHGIILDPSQDQVAKAYDLFRRKSSWKNYELNHELGWQFGQVIERLRRDGKNIVASRDSSVPGGRVWRYTLVEGPAPVRKRMVTCPDCAHEFPLTTAKRRFVTT